MGQVLRDTQTAAGQEESGGEVPSRVQRRHSRYQRKQDVVKGQTSLLGGQNDHTGLWNRCGEL